MSSYYDEFKDTIGEMLGIKLALAEDDVQEDRNALAAMQEINQIAGIYKNFATGGLTGFKEDFDKGYVLGKRDVRSRQDLGQSFGSDNPIISSDEPTVG